MEPTRTVEVTFRDEAVDDVLSVFEEVGGANVKRLRRRGMTGVEVVCVGVVVVGALANLIIRLLPLWKCGVLVDARGSKYIVEKNCNLPRGSVLVIKPDGAEVELHEPSEIKSLMDGVIPAGKELG